MSDVKRLALPLVIIIVSAFITQWIQQYMSGEFVHTILVIITIAALFAFGVALHGGAKKASKAVFRKVAAIVIVILLLFMQLGYFSLPAIEQVFTYLGLDAFYMNMIYIFCGYLFVD